MIRAILATDNEWGIGKDGNLPWPHNPSDLRWFKACTDANNVVMGRKTWESLPIKPLPNRLNFVITSTNMEHYNPRPHCTYSGENAGRIIKEIIDTRYKPYDTWIIGGAQLVESCLDVIDEIWLSRIDGNYDCDTFLPRTLIEELFVLSDSGWDTTHNVYVDKYKRRK